MKQYNELQNIYIDLKIIFSHIFNTTQSNLYIENVTNNDKYFSFIIVKKKFTINEIHNFNKIFGLSNTKVKNLKYKIYALKDNKTINVDFMIDKFKNISLFNNDEFDKIEHNLKNLYNKHINDFKDLIFDIFKEDKNINIWTFYYGNIKNKNSFAFANGNLKSSKCIKCRDYINDNKYDETSIYNKCYKVIGNEAHAKCITFRRNKNSLYKGNWKYCICNTPFYQLV